MANITRRELVAGSAAVAVTTTGGIAGRTIRRQGAGQAGTTTKARRGLAIVHTNDSHGHDVPDEESMGMAAVAALRDSLEGQGYEVLVFDAGDAAQGTTLVNYSKGESAFELLNAVGYDAMALGNHEFDYGQDALRGYMAQATFPLLSANVFYEATGERFAEPHTTFTLRDGSKLGVFALTTPETKTTASPLVVEGLEFAAGEELYGIAQKEADALRADGCDLVIMLAHLGEEDVSVPNRVVDVIAHVTGIDIVIDGHDHQEEQHVLADAAGKGVLVVETGCYTHNLGLITYEDGKLASTLLGPDDFLGLDPEVAALANSIKKEVDKALDVVVATSDYKLSGARKPGLRDHETNLGDFVCDAILWAAQTYGAGDTDCALMGGAALRAGIDAGDITMNDILTVLPFFNDMVTVTVPGRALLEGIEAASCKCPDELNGFAQVSGITYEVNTLVAFESAGLYPDSTYQKPAKPGGRVTIKTVGGEPFDPAASYTIATSSFYGFGGDSYYVFRDHADTLRYLGKLDYECVVSYITEALGGTVGAEYADENGEGRVTVIE